VGRQESQAVRKDGGVTMAETNTKADDLRKRVLALYEPPFKFDGISYVWDANGEMVLDGKDDREKADLRGPIVLVRGWGRISYMADPEGLHTAVGELIAEALTEYWERRKEPA